MSHAAWLPPLRHTESGADRRVGIELEFAGLAIEEISALVAGHVGGEREVISDYEHRVHSESHGDWHVEFDFAWLKQWGRERGDAPAETIDELLERIVRSSAEPFVPMEVVTPPLPMLEIGALDGLIAKLRDAGARGTRDGVTYAFGMHLNPEMPALDAAIICCYLKAFLCLFDWIKEQAAVDLTRRLMPYIDPFPARYVRRVVDPDYWPEREALIDDYLADNPTRNRALDLLPLFAHVDPARVRRGVDDPRVKARPALHYRLPNCEIDRPDFSVVPAWRDWLQVEELVADEDRLRRLCAAYTEFLASPLERAFQSWAAELSQWLSDDR